MPVVREAMRRRWTNHSNEATTPAAIRSDVLPPRAYHSITSIPKDFPYLLPHLSVQPRTPPSPRDRSAQTILLIHGAFSSHTEWRDVIKSPYLSSYHLLVPSLHSSGPNTALGIRPFTLPRVAELLAHLVRTVANGGTAHIVGVSLGAHIGIALASLYPSVCTQANRVVFVSGYNRFQAPRWLRPVLPYVCYGLIKGPNLLPEGLVKWAMDGADVTGAEGLGKQGREEVKEEDKEVNGTCTMELTREIIGPVFKKSDDCISSEGLQGRVCIVAATKGNLLVPSDDKIPHARLLLQRLAGEDGRYRNGKMLVKHSQMRHPWNLQAPELFADSVVAWINEKTLPDGFEVC